MSKKMTIELAESNTCCKATHTEQTNDFTSKLIKELEASGSKLALVSPLPCCKNETVFVKLSNQLLTHTESLFKIFTDNVPYIISPPIIHDLVEDIRYYQTAELSPPGLPVYIEHASLRL